MAGTKQFLHSDQLLHFNHFHESENQNDIPIFQMTDKKIKGPPNFSIDHQSASIDHFWSIDQGGYNWLKLPVKTTPDFDRPTLLPGPKFKKLFMLNFSHLCLKFQLLNNYNVEQKRYFLLSNSDFVFILLINANNCRVNFMLS